MGTMMRSIKRIRVRYIGCWLKHQLSQPHWFHNLFVNRKAWGAFSIYAHLKRSDLRPKAVYSTKELAQIAADRNTKTYEVPFVVYKCLFCEGWHVSKVSYLNMKTTPVSMEDTLKKYVVQVPTATAGLDMDRVLSTNIPELATVYGGLRGRTLSSVRQLYAWKTLVESGIKQVIDLRADYISDFYPELCKRSGVGYFHYPVAYDEHSIATMVELFPEFCALIDKGCFYISCAMGLHRTDIALCTYWVFYGADKGIAPPLIRGYRKDKGMKTIKIMRVLDAMYDRMTSQNGIVPMAEEIFRERKEIINEQSKMKENV